MVVKKGTQRLDDVVDCYDGAGSTDASAAVEDDLAIWVVLLQDLLLVRLLGLARWLRRN